VHEPERQDGDNEHGEREAEQPAHNIAKHAHLLSDDTQRVYRRAIEDGAKTDRNQYSKGLMRTERMLASTRWYQ